MNMVFSPMDLLIVAALAATTVLLLGIAFVLRSNEKRQQARRVRRAKRQSTASENAGAVNVRRDTGESRVPLLNTIVNAVMPNPAKLRARIARTGKRITLGQYFVTMLVIAAIVAVVQRVVFDLPAIAALLIGVSVGIGTPHKVIGFLGKRRMTKFNNLFPEAIDLIVRGLRSGLPVSESLKTVAREVADPVGPEFAQISDSITFGMTMQEALWAAAARLDIPEYRFFAITLAIQQETGGNLAETLDNLSSVLRRRKQMRLKIKALSSEAKASAYIIGSLPFVMFGIILAMNPTYAMKLFTDPRGLLMVGGAFLCYLLGISIMAKMVRFEI